MHDELRCDLCNVIIRASPEARRLGVHCDSCGASILEPLEQTAPPRDDSGRPLEGGQVRAGRSFRGHTPVSEGIPYRRWRYVEARLLPGAPDVRLLHRDTGFEFTRLAVERLDRVRVLSVRASEARRASWRRGSVKALPWAIVPSGALAVAGIAASADLRGASPGPILLLAAALGVMLYVVTSLVYSRELRLPSGRDDWSQVTIDSSGASIRFLADPGDVADLVATLRSIKPGIDVGAAAAPWR
jgi:hypothetical protein